jgi:hypothetical protein
VPSSNRLVFPALQPDVEVAQTEETQRRARSRSTRPRGPRRGQGVPQSKERPLSRSRRLRRSSGRCSLLSASHTSVARCAGAPDLTSRYFTSISMELLYFALRVSSFGLATRRVSPRLHRGQGHMARADYDWRLWTSEHGCPTSLGRTRVSRCHAFEPIARCARDGRWEVPRHCVEQRGGTWVRQPPSHPWTFDSAVGKATGIRPRSRTRVGRGPARSFWCGRGHRVVHCCSFPSRRTGRSSSPFASCEDQCRGQLRDGHKRVVSGC